MGSFYNLLFTPAPRVVNHMLFLIPVLIGCEPSFSSVFFFYFVCFFIFVFTVLCGVLRHLSSPSIVGSFPDVSRPICFQKPVPCPAYKNDFSLKILRVQPAFDLFPPPLSCTHSPTRNTFLANTMAPDTLLQRLLRSLHGSSRR